MTLRTALAKSLNTVAVRLVESVGIDNTIEMFRRSLPDGAPSGSREILPPVLLVHGVGANHRNNDLHPDFSLARHLAALGRDVWLLTLRSGLGRWSRTTCAA